MTWLFQPYKGIYLRQPTDGYDLGHWVALSFPRAYWPESQRWTICTKHRRCAPEFRNQSTAKASLKWWFQQVLTSLGGHLVTCHSPPESTPVPQWIYDIRMHFVVRGKTVRAMICQRTITAVGIPVWGRARGRFTTVNRPKRRIRWRWLWYPSPKWVFRSTVDNSGTGNAPRGVLVTHDLDPDMGRWIFVSALISIGLSQWLFGLEVGQHLSRFWLDSMTFWLFMYAKQAAMGRE